jgi:hypothetical protein
LERLELLGGLGLNVHHHGKLGCSISHRSFRHQIDLRCHIDLLRIVVDFQLVDIVVERVVELAVVVLVERQASDRR